MTEPGWVDIREIVDDDRPLVQALLLEHWGGEEMVLRGTVYHPAGERALIAWADGQGGGQHVGLLTWRDAEGDEWEILSLDAVPGRRGVGPERLRFLKGGAEREGHIRLSTVTTNDNLDALAFWQKRGFRLIGLAPKAVAATGAI